MTLPEIAKLGDAMTKQPIAKRVLSKAELERRHALQAVYRDGSVGIGRGPGRPVRYETGDGRFTVIPDGKEWLIYDRDRQCGRVTLLREAREHIAIVREVTE